MANSVEPDNKKYTFSREGFGLLLSWFFFATIMFILVVMSHQLAVGILSHFMGYETHIYFGKVDSSSHLNKFWSSTRVVLLYAFPTLLLLLISGILLAGFYWSPRQLNIWRWLRFWVMVFAALFSTTMLSLPLITTILEKGSLYQGFVVIFHWFGASGGWAIFLFAVSVIANFTVGFLCSPILTYLAPPDFMVRKGKKHPRRIVMNSFVLVILLIFPISIFLSSPFFRTFFIVMFIHAILWLPGLFNINNQSLINRSSRKNIIQPYSNYLLGGLTLSLIILVKIFFS
jgi:hypothetical protein